MLVLSRRRNEAIIIDPRNCPTDENGLIKIIIVELRGDKARLGIEADPKIPVHRQEVYDAIQRERKSPCNQEAPNTTNGEPSKPISQCDPPLSKIAEIRAAKVGG